MENYHMESILFDALPWGAEVVVECERKKWLPPDMFWREKKTIFSFCCCILRLPVISREDSEIEAGSMVL